MEIVASEGRKFKLNIWDTRNFHTFLNYLRF